MLIGDPFKFAVLISAVNEWSDCGDISGGVMIIIVDGFMFPANEVLNICLDCEIPEFIDNLKKIPINKEVFNLKNKESAFVGIYNRAYHSLLYEEDCFDNDWHYKIAPMEFLDKGLIVFAVSDGENVRILASQLKYIKKKSCHKLENIAVKEAFATCADIDIIITKLREWLNNYYNGSTE